MARFVRNNTSILDIATGTGDVIISLIRQKNIKMAVGIDMAQNMLLKAKYKILRLKSKKQVKNESQDIVFIKADAMKLPFLDKSFDVVTIAFGIRNMTDSALLLKEIFRVLKEGGRVVILEFSLPNNVILRKIYFLYLRYILPVIGAIISGEYSAYRYLNKTIETFPYGEDFLNLMRDSGFKKNQFYPQTFGVSTIYVGEKIASGRG